MKPVLLSPQSYQKKRMTMQLTMQPTRLQGPDLSIERSDRFSPDQQQNMWHVISQEYALGRKAYFHVVSTDD
jgi:hypothetical protein